MTELMIVSMIMLLTIWAFIGLIVLLLMLKLRNMVKRALTAVFTIRLTGRKK